MNTEVSRRTELQAKNSLQLENRDELVQAIASRIYQSFVDVNKDQLRGPLDPTAVQRIISEAVSPDHKANDHVYQSNCVVENKKYFGDAFEPGLHNSELNYEDLPRPVTELNRTAVAAPNGKKVKGNVLHFLEKGKQRLFQSSGDDGGSVASSDPPTPKARRKPMMTGNWDQVRQKIFPAKKINSAGKLSLFCARFHMFMLKSLHLCFRKSGPHSFFHVNY